MLTTLVRNGCIGFMLCSCFFRSPSFAQISGIPRSVYNSSDATSVKIFIPVDDALPHPCRDDEPVLHAVSGTLKMSDSFRTFFLSLTTKPSWLSEDIPSEWGLEMVKTFNKDGGALSLSIGEGD